MQTWTAKKLDTGNNESLVAGITEDRGTFTAVTYTRSKDFKTFKGAEKWLREAGFHIPLAEIVSK